MVERAKTMLDDGASVRAVATDLGYGRPEAFSKAFYAYTGRWPSQWAGFAYGAEAMILRLGGHAKLFVLE